MHRVQTNDVYAAVGPYNVRTGQLVYMNDSNLAAGGRGGTERHANNHDDEYAVRAPDVRARFYIDFAGPDAEIFGIAAGVATDVAVEAQTALFGGNPTHVDARTGLRAAQASGEASERDERRSQDGPSLGVTPEN